MEHLSRPILGFRLLAVTNLAVSSKQRSALLEAQTQMRQTGMMNESGRLTMVSASDSITRGTIIGSGFLLRFEEGYTAETPLQ